MEKARSLWPDTLKDLPKGDEHKKKLKEHWNALCADFKIETERKANFITNQKSNKSSSCPASRNKSPS